jgi:hypothetical protein
MSASRDEVSALRSRIYELQLSERAAWLRYENATNLLNSVLRDLEKQAVELTEYRAYKLKKKKELAAD